MDKEPKTNNRHADTPRDKPQAERVEHANLERPGAQAPPRAAARRDWSKYTQRGAWTLH